MMELCGGFEKGEIISQSLTIRGDNHQSLTILLCNGPFTITPKL